MLKHLPYVTTRTEKKKQTQWWGRNSSRIRREYESKTHYFADRASLFRGVFSSPKGFVAVYLLGSLGWEDVSTFPSTVHRRGGAAFVVVYACLALAFVMPLFIIELGLSQFYSFSEAKLFRVVPYFRGLGWSIYIVNFFLNIPYSSMNGWIIYYIINSFKNKKYWWSKCHHIVPGLKCVSTLNMSNEIKSEINPVKMYFEFEVKGSRSLIDGLPYTFESSLHGIRFWHTIAVFIVWTLITIFACLIVKLYVKFLYIILATMVLILITLTIKFAFLPGSLIGLYAYLFPNLDNLFTVRTLVDAVTLIMASMCIAKGNATFASLNPFKYNFHKVSYIVIFIDILFGFICGIMIFSMLGFLSKTLNISISELMKEEILFVNFFEAATFLPMTHLWTNIFLLFLLILGVTSIAVPCASCTISIIDIFPKYINYSETKKLLICVAICFCNFLLSTFFCLKGSALYLDVFTQQISNVTNPVLIIIEVLMIHFLYGEKRLHIELKMMLNYTLSVFWSYSSFTLIPILIVFVLCYSIYTDIIVKLPIWTVLSVKLITILSVLPLIIYFIMEAVKNFKTQNGLDIIKVGMKTNETYGPYYKSNWLFSRYYQRKLVVMRKNPKFIKTLRETENLDEVLDNLIEIGERERIYREKVNFKKFSVKKTIL